MNTKDTVLSFWFGDINAPNYPQENNELWWGKSEATDHSIRTQFLELYEEIRSGVRWSGARGTLATIIVLDQFPRNMFRGTSRMYESDAEAQDLVLIALEQGLLSQLHPVERQFLILPLMHAENIALQRKCVRLHQQQAADGPAEDVPRVERLIDFAIRHRDIVERFGRFPHRNAILGRHSSDAEEEFLKQPGSSF